MNELNQIDAQKEQSRKDRIVKIAATGPLVTIFLQSGKQIHLTREEALKRAQLAVGLDREGLYLAEAIIKAANEARINELGRGYDSKNLDFMLFSAEKDHKESLKRK